MQIELTSQQKINLKGKRVIVTPFFGGEKTRINDFGFGKEGDDFSKELRDLEDGKIRLFFCGKRKLVFFNLGGRGRWNQRKFLLALKKTILFLKENKIEEAILLFDKIIPKESNLGDLMRQVSENI